MISLIIFAIDYTNMTVWQYVCDSLKIPLVFVYLLIF